MRDVMSRFWEKVEKCPVGCWSWVGATVSKKPDRAYGQFWLNNRLVLAHRFLYEQEHGPVPAGLDLDHLCRNPRCVRPSHLEPVTRSENALRGKNSWPRTHCKRGHSMTEENTYVSPTSGLKTCHKCKIMNDRARRRARALLEKK